MLDPAEIDIAKAVVDYRNRFLKSVIHDLLVRFGKREILPVVAQCMYEIDGKNPVLINDDGSRWLSFDDYEAPKMDAKTFLSLWLDGDESKVHEIILTNGWIEMTADRLSEILEK